MTVAEIKEYIDICLREPQGRYMYEQRVRMLESNLRKIKSMLDELKENNK